MGVPDANGAKPTIVVVDNDAALVGALKFALELEGFGVDTFLSGAEVLAEKNLPSYGCMVVDFHLAGMNGLDLVAALRARAVNLPVVLVAGHTPPNVRRRAKAEGLPIVDKPLLGNNLIDAIHDALKAPP